MVNLQNKDVVCLVNAIDRPLDREFCYWCWADGHAVTLLILAHGALDMDFRATLLGVVNT